jgi:hypothetical protein
VNDDFCAQEPEAVEEGQDDSQSCMLQIRAYHWKRSKNEEITERQKQRQRSNYQKSDCYFDYEPRGQGCWMQAKQGDNSSQYSTNHVSVVVTNEEEIKILKKKSGVKNTEKKK